MNFALVYNKTSIEALSVYFSYTLDSRNVVSIDGLLNILNILNIFPGFYALSGGSPMHTSELTRNSGIRLVERVNSLEFTFIEYWE